MTPQRPRWSYAFPIAGLVALAIGVAADLRWFDARVFADHDKLLHFLLYGGCGFFAVGWFHRTSAVTVLAVVAAIVAAEELSQGLFGHRSVDVFDAIASIGGIVICGAVAARLRPTSSARCESASPP